MRFLKHEPYVDNVKTHNHNFKVFKAFFSFFLTVFQGFFAITFATYQRFLSTHTHKRIPEKFHKKGLKIARPKI